MGISAGGSAALASQSELDLPAFAVYPLLWPLPENLLKARKSTVVSGRNDDWTPIHHAREFQRLTNNTLYEVDGFHGFLKPQEDRFLKDVITFRSTAAPVPAGIDFECLDQYSCEYGVRVRFDSTSRDQCLRYFKDFIERI
jgi:hypothetical protein